MPLARVKPGCTHGYDDRYAAGAVFEATPQELRDFADKLEAVEPDEAMAAAAAAPEPEPAPAFEPDESNPEPEPESAPSLDITAMTVDEVLAAVEAGEISAFDAYEAEEASRGRVTLLRHLRPDTD